VATTLLDRVADLIRVRTSEDEVPDSALEQSEFDVLASLAELLAGSGGAAHASELSAERALLVEEWIDAHLHDVITLGRLCEVAGVGGRCLQKTFFRPARFHANPVRDQSVASRPSTRSCWEPLRRRGDVDRDGMRIPLTWAGSRRCIASGSCESPSKTLRRRVPS